MFENFILHIAYTKNLYFCWQAQGAVRDLTVKIGTYMGSYVSSWQELVTDLPDTGGNSQTVGALKLSYYMNQRKR
jgi:hypothetical protein